MFGRKKLLSRIRDLEDRITRLENMHAHIYPNESWMLPNGARAGLDWMDDNGDRGFYYGRQLTYDEIRTAKSHPQPQKVEHKRIINTPPLEVSTDAVDNVSLEELARFVIDGTPIERTEKFEGEKIVKYDKFNKTEMVDTPIGKVMVSGPRLESK